MTFWTYMLHCRGGYYYVGHTDDLERRMGEHQSGLVRGFASDHHPATLVWSETFPSRIEAIEAERRLKGWGQAKKRALIRGDWSLVSDLAKKKDSASTSSARTGRGLAFHPQHPPVASLSIFAQAMRRRDTMSIRYSVGDPTLSVLLPPPSASGERRDGLWQTTCFEAFVRGHGAIGYHEFNFAPSGDWASYSFDAHRAGMREAAGEPVIERADDGVSVTVDLSAYPDLVGADWHVGLSAVIEEKDGTKSYWALKHPEGAPDFHDAACFVLELPATP